MVFNFSYNFKSIIEGQQNKMKNMIKLAVLAMFISVPMFGQSAVTPPAPVQAPTTEPTNTGTAATLSELDQLKFENSVLKAGQASEAAKQAAESFANQKNEVYKVIQDIEHKYNATFDAKTAKFIINSKPEASKPKK
jgi:membrane-bound lytic murein transglycosylase